MLADARSSPASLLETPRGALASLTFDRFSASLLFLALGCAACLMPAQTDTWWLLRTGEDIWTSGAVHLRDNLSFTVDGKYWPNREWLSEVLFYQLHELGGMPLLTATAAALVLATWVLVWRRVEGNPTLRLAVVAFALIPSASAWSLRPQLFTLFLIAVTSYLLERRRYGYLPLLFVIWANLHGGVVLGIGLLTASTAHAALRGRRAPTGLLITLVLCVVATALTPLGWSLWTEIPSTLARLRQHQVIEWQPPRLTDLNMLPFWLMSAAIVLLGFSRPAKLMFGVDSHAPVIGALALLPFAVTSSRNVSPFLLLAAPALASLIEWRLVSPVRRPERRERPIVNLCVLIAAGLASATIVVYAWTFQIARLQWRPLPPDTIAAVRACPGPMYNNYDDGGYLTWFVRDRKVFLDSRLDPYPAALIETHVRTELSGDYQALFTQYQIQCALTRAGSPLAERLTDDGWRALHTNAKWQVLTRN